VNNNDRVCQNQVLIELLAKLEKEKFERMVRQKAKHLSDVAFVNQNARGK
jgi:hypothetical protein